VLTRKEKNIANTPETKEVTIAWRMTKGARKEYTPEERWRAAY